MNRWDYLADDEVAYDESGFPTVSNTLAIIKAEYDKLMANEKRNLTDEFIGVR